MPAEITLPGVIASAPPVPATAVPAEWLYPAMAAVPVSQPTAVATAPASSFFGNTSGSMLGTVAATAASVAAGAFLFQGISHLMNGNSHQTMADNSSTANLSNADGGLLPGYFDQDQTDSSPLESLPDESDNIV